MHNESGSKDLKHTYRQAKELIEGAQLIYLCAHTHADGDAWGSVLALEHYLQGTYPEKEVVALSADTSGVQSEFSFLLGSIRVISSTRINQTPDLFIACDVPNQARLNKAEKLYRHAERRLVFDHHIQEGMEANVVLADSSAAATGVVIYRYLKWCKAVITPHIAQCLYTALMCDTALFMNQNTTADVLSMASDLAKAGASPSGCAQNIFENKTLAQLHLEARVLQRMSLLCDGQVAYSYATLQDLEDTGATKDDCSGLIDLVRQCTGSRVALFMRELTRDGDVRVNLRARDSVDVACVAREMGGGGHRAAAGFSASGDMNTLVKKICELLKVAIDRSPDPQ